MHNITLVVLCIVANLEELLRVMAVVEWPTCLQVTWGTFLNAKEQVCAHKVCAHKLYFAYTPQISHTRDFCLNPGIIPRIQLLRIPGMIPSLLRASCSQWILVLPSVTILLGL